jgi:hypothetical protein
MYILDNLRVLLTYLLNSILKSHRVNSQGWYVIRRGGQRPGFRLGHGGAKNISIFPLDFLGLYLTLLLYCVKCLNIVLL